jgi:hypothetical protein
VPEAAIAQREGTSFAAGDRTVVCGLALGWEMADLYAAPGSAAPNAASPGRLPPVGELGSHQRLQGGIARIAMLARQALGDLAVPSTEALRALKPGDPVASRQALHEFHVALATALAATGTAAPQAYDLGRSLADICRDPSDLSELMARLDTRAVVPIQGRLADLSTKLPPHAAAAVAATLEQWCRWTIDARARESMDDVRGALSRQGTLWRALLTGDKDATEMLDPDTVIAASVRHASKLGTLIRGLAGAYLPAVGLLTVVSGLLVYAIVVQSGIATVVAALGALGATLMVIRKALELTVTDTMAELRRRLWGAELDAAVAQSILRLPPRTPPPPHPKSTPVQPIVVPEPETKTGLTQRIERALHVTRSARAQGFRVPASGPAGTASQPPQDGAGANGKPAP